MNRAENSTIFRDILGISTGLAFLLIYIFPIEGIVVAGSLYICCGIFSVFMIKGVVIKGLSEEKRLYPAIGVLLCSIQFALRIFLGIQEYNLLLGYLIPILGILGFAYYVVDWCKSRRQISGLIILVSLGSLLVFGLAYILSLEAEEINIAFHMFDWIFYSVPLVIGSALIANKRKVNSWIIYLAFVPFFGLELFPYIIPSAISNQMYSVLRLSKLLLIFVFFVLIPVINIIFQEKRFFLPGIIGTAIILLIVINLLKGIVILGTRGFLIETSILTIVILDTFLVALPIGLLYLADWRETRDFNYIEKG